MMINSLLILGVTLISFSLVFAEYKLLRMGSSSEKETAIDESEISFGNYDKKGDYTIGEYIHMPITVDSMGVPINAVQADLGFDPQAFELIDILTDDSFANIFIQKEINNEKGYARLVGGLPNPGFVGSHGIFGTALLKTKKSGNLIVNYLPSCLILANDGKSTNLLKKTAPVIFAVKNEPASNEIIMKQELDYKRRRTVFAQNQLKMFTDSVVLGASTSKELEKSAKEAVRKNKGSYLERFDLWALNYWLKWLRISI